MPGVWDDVDEPPECNREEGVSYEAALISEMIRQHARKIFLKGFGIGFVIGVIVALPIAFVVLRF